MMTKIIIMLLPAKLLW